MSIRSGLIGLAAGTALALGATAPSAFAAPAPTFTTPTLTTNSNPISLTPAGTLTHTRADTHSASAPLTPPTSLPRPSTAAPGLSPLAPIGGTVPGASGAAARALAGPAAATMATTLADRSASSPTLHTDWGLYLPNSDADGIEATQSIVPGLTTTGGDYLYAATAKAPGGSCVELTTAYTTKGPLLWAWDWCGSVSAAKTVAMNRTFVATYTTTVDGHPAYTMDEALTGANNTWTVYLYNYKTQQWDTFYSSSGTDKSGFSFGWDTYEIWSNTNPATHEGYFCGNSAGDTVQSSDILLYSGGAWVAASSANSYPSSTPPPSGSSFDCPTLSFRLATPNHWIATNK